MTALSSDTNKVSETKPDIVVTLMESTLNPHQFAFSQQSIPPLSMF